MTFGLKIWDPLVPISAVAPVSVMVLARKQERVSEVPCLVGCTARAFECIHVHYNQIDNPL